MICAASDRNCSRFCHSNARCAGQPDEGLVHQRRALQRVIAAFARHLPAGKAPHVVVDHGPERLERGLVAIGPGLQETGDFAGRLFVVLVIQVHAALWREFQPTSMTFVIQTTKSALCPNFAPLQSCRTNMV